MTSTPSGPVETAILPPVRDLGDGFAVRRALPSPGRRMVGPFVFLDHFGPARFAPGEGLDVRPHPHIGLATVTYLLDGEILHRDSLGSVQAIRPGAVNWMTAGSGIVHSERTAPAARAAGQTLAGFQLWVALPAAQEEAAPAFRHHPAATIPTATTQGATVTVIAGRHDGLVSPVETPSAMVCADIALAPATRYRLDCALPERALYVAGGGIGIGDDRFAAGTLVVLRRGAGIVIAAEEGARLLLVGGEPFPEPRHLFWNFVSSRRERIERAREDWRAGRFPAVPGETGGIPLPHAPPPVAYP